VETGRYGVRGVGRLLQHEDHEKITRAMEATGVTTLAGRLFRTLSGGEQQRALLARALCLEPNILVLDEPTASMDERGAQEAMKLTLGLASERGAAILMVNHFIDLVAEVSHQVVVLDRDHKAVLVGAPKDVLQLRGRLVHGG
ncbi:MAG: ATP-binding cassette domain-containing protein, partial [Bdellovibrionota bacterium]